MKPIQIQLLDHGYCHEVETWGSDERIIEAARMSTNKGFQGWEQDAKLLRYLWKNRHLSPFEQCGLTVEVQAPIMVFREWHRHRTQSYNEMSGRYTELPNLYYIPALGRIQKNAVTNKQGSGETFDREDATWIRNEIEIACGRARVTYERLLSEGVAKELARLVLPVNQYSRMRASANLRNWLQFLTLRLDPAAQFEIRVYAEAVAGIISERFPRTYGLFKETQ
jgi:thymidylate synthase (FAD)